MELIRAGLMMRRHRLAFVMKAVEQFGDVVHIKIGRRNLFLVSHPDHVNHVLVKHPDRYVKGLGLDEARFFLGDGLLTSEGEQWRSQRSRVHRLFAAGRIESHLRVATELAQSMLDGWMADREGREIDLSRELNRLTISIASRGLLGVEIQDPDGLVEAFERAERQAVKEMVRLVRLPSDISLRRNVAWRRARAEVDRKCNHLITQIEAGDSAATTTVELGTGRELRDQVVTLLLTGHETTTTAILWSLILLERHPDVAAAVQDEVDQELGGAEPPTEVLPRLRLVKMLVAESLRLHPPVWMISRRAVTHDALGSYEIPEGSQVLISPFAVHRHPDFWPDHSRFDMERFRHGVGNVVHKCAYIPFGLGPRGCVGFRLGMSEVILVLGLILHRCSTTILEVGQIRGDAQLALHPMPHIHAMTQGRSIDSSGG